MNQTTEHLQKRLELLVDRYEMRRTGKSLNTIRNERLKSQKNSLNNIKITQTMLTLDKPIAMRMSKQDAEKLKSIARSNYCTVSTYCRQIIKREIDNNEK